MNEKKMVRVNTVFKDENGDVQGGMDFYWTPGNRIVLTQEWEYRCAGPDWGKITPDHMSGTNLLDYIQENWVRDDRDWYITDVEDDFC